MTELALSENALDSFNYHSTMVDLSRVLKLKILFSDPNEFVSKTQTKLLSLLQRTNHVHSFELSFEHGFVSEPLLIESICLLVPRHVKHLNIEVRTLLNINLVLERLQHLTSITFRNLHSSILSIEKLTEWYAQLNRDLTYRYHNGSLRLWLDKPFE